MATNQNQISLKGEILIQRSTLVDAPYLYAVHNKGWVKVAADYSASTTGVHVDIDAGTGQGGVAESDGYPHTYFAVIGTDHDDKIVADKEDHTLHPLLHGGKGNDTLIGAMGHDTLLAATEMTCWPAKIPASRRATGMTSIPTATIF